jgi:hypothetical protein
VIVSTIFHANRIGLINRCIGDARELYKTLQKISSYVCNNLSCPISMFTTLILKGESLSRNLCMNRHYIHISNDIIKEDRQEKRRRIDIDITYDPRYLVFEFTWNLMLRKPQVEMVVDYLESIRTGKSMVKQMIMGAGKTTVVCPLLTLMLGDGNHLVVQVVPPALLDFSRSVMRSTFSSIMYKRIFTLNFDRSTEVNPNIHRKLISAVRNRGVIITTPTSVKSMMLKFLELMNMIRDTTVQRSMLLEKDCQELGKILNLFQDSILIMDEVDLILHPLKSELNFPIGPKHELDFSPQRWQLPIHLLDGIFYAENDKITVSFKQSTRAKLILKQLKKVILFGYNIRALQKVPHVVLLNVDWYNHQLLPVLAEWMYMWLEAQHLTGLSEMDVIKYLKEGANNEYNTQLAELIDTKLSSNHKKMLNLSRDWLCSYLPHCLQKIDRVSFGIMNEDDYKRAKECDPYMPRTRAKLSIPFIGKDVPSRSSEFAHPDIIIGLTILSYRYEGLRWTDFIDLIESMRSALTKELGPWEKRKSNLRFSKWIKEAGGTFRGVDNVEDDTNFNDIDNSLIKKDNSNDDNDNVVISLRLLKRSNDNQMRKIFNLVKLLPSSIHFYLENFIFVNYMDNKVTKLSAAGQELGGQMLFRKRIGFSGTPSDLLPVELGDCGYEKCSDGQMIHVLTSPNICSYELAKEGWTPLSLLERIAQSTEPTFNALIDTGM